MVQSRIHFLGFLTEKEYFEGEIESESCYVANPKFFATKHDAQTQFASFPLKRKRDAKLPEG